MTFDFMFTDHAEQRREERDRASLRALDKKVSSLTFKGRWTRRGKEDARVRLGEYTTGEGWTMSLRMCLGHESTTVCTPKGCRTIPSRKKLPKKIDVVITNEKGTRPNQFTGLTLVYATLSEPRYKNRVLANLEVAM